ncbi:MAG: hypothetical protein R3204_02555 [Oceanospirillum sp.]|nr:hypothetical protein [Oceanospirillum sp.]
MVRSLGLGLVLSGTVLLAGCSSAAEDYARAKAEAEMAREQKASQQEQQLRRDADNAFRELDQQ